MLFRLTNKMTLKNSTACRDCRVRLVPFVAGELSLEDEARLNKHLSRCSSCRQEEQTQRGLSAILSRSQKTAPAALPPADLWRRIEAEIAPVQPHRHRFFPAAQPLFLTTGAVAAATLGLVSYLQFKPVVVSEQSLGTVVVANMRTAPAPPKTTPVPKLVPSAKVVSVVKPVSPAVPSDLPSASKAALSDEATAIVRPARIAIRQRIVNRPFAAPRMAVPKRSRPILVATKGLTTPAADAPVYVALADTSASSHSRSNGTSLGLESAPGAGEASPVATITKLGRSAWVTTALADEPQASDAVNASEVVSLASRRLGLFSHQTR